MRTRTELLEEALRLSQLAGVLCGKARSALGRGDIHDCNVWLAKSDEAQGLADELVSLIRQRDATYAASLA